MMNVKENCSETLNKINFFFSESFSVEVGVTLYRARAVSRFVIDRALGKLDNHQEPKGAPPTTVQGASYIPALTPLNSFQEGKLRHKVLSLKRTVVI